MSRRNALDIPKLNHAEAGSLAQAEYERVLAVLKTLDGDDWQQPTYCTEWNVRQMVAHLAGAAAGSSSFAEFRRQNLQLKFIREYENPVDGTNELQLHERAGNMPAELVAEFEQKGQQAALNRRNLPWLVRKITVPMGPMGLTSIGYLMDTIYPRDQWMHRYDLCAATGKQMELTAEHDGRIVALVLLDIAEKLRKELVGRTIALQLSGPAGGEYLFGKNALPNCTLGMDLFDFNLRASGRITIDETLQKTVISGDEATAEWFLSSCEVTY